MLGYSLLLTGLLSVVFMRYTAASLCVTYLVQQANLTTSNYTPTLRHNSSSNNHAAPDISLLRHFTLTLLPRATPRSATVCYDDSATEHLTVANIQRPYPCSTSRTPWKSGFEDYMADGHAPTFVSCCPVIMDPILLKPQNIYVPKREK
jgi:hypothetical protein